MKSTWTTEGTHPRDPRQAEEDHTVATKRELEQIEAEDGGFAAGMIEEMERGECGTCQNGEPGPGCEFYGRAQAGDTTWRDQGDGTRRPECVYGCGCEVTL
jgi:hypothetical protein